MTRVHSRRCAARDTRTARSWASAASRDSTNVNVCPAAIPGPPRTHRRRARCPPPSKSLPRTPGPELGKREEKSISLFTVTDLFPLHRDPGPLQCPPKNCSNAVPAPVPVAVSVFKQAFRSHVTAVAMTDELLSAVQMHAMSVLRAMSANVWGIAIGTGLEVEKEEGDAQSTAALDRGLLHAPRRAGGDAVFPELGVRAVVREGEDEGGGDESELHGDRGVCVRLGRVQDG